ncbi:MAG TPA: nicotinate-nucleotide--dimethylbenzimidazole phosphoribosyltransferase [Intrasporangium sp.]|uniref:nicotinate-nucleotide--dimethylbenzimidazole phosphoribosyltransferase n=1 Tax=Intrasporangium sp. TaxID=1925024 RepID=UPI002D76615E|nr:nicotinate-nucleotide--dimethylbenzimidazole phosphoribosyltransferase [Intrasporangium sp.]HET7399638.1 nicotinate-nucleotide--dimethylbenzimidazole phosphoribosyltransferase [Intrasporangium sp.]
MTLPPHVFPEAARQALHDVLRHRRDIRRGFTPQPVDEPVLTRVLTAAHRAPSVGLSQPWDFLLLTDEEQRRSVQRLAAAQRDRFAASLPGARARMFDGLKVEAILEAPLNIVVTCDPTRGGPFTLGRHADPRMASFSAALAVQNLWLAARAEGLGVGWVSFFDPVELADLLGLPAHVEVVAYLCVGHVAHFPPAPELALAGWARTRPLGWAVHHGAWGRRRRPGGEPVTVLEETTSAIEPVSASALAEAQQRQGSLTKPPGALGRLEELGNRLCAMYAACPPPLPEPVAVAVFAADHGVHAQGVSPWPQEVTGQMVANFLAGGAAVNALARQCGAEVSVVDVGVAVDLGDAPGLVRRKVRRGTADLTAAPAMTAEEAQQAIETGIDVARDLVAQGNRLLVAGDMGIANTTASAALVAVFTGRPVHEVTGRGTGIDDATLAHKMSVVSRALDLHRPTAAHPLGALACVGGLEHAAIVGFLLGAAALRTPVVLDGLIACSAALVARAVAPTAADYWIAGHRSSEPGASAALAALGLEPLVDLGLRLGEGSGALLAVPTVQAAARVLRDMATFDSAGVTGKA